MYTYHSFYITYEARKVQLPLHIYISLKIQPTAQVLNNLYGLPTIVTETLLYAGYCTGVRRLTTALFALPQSATNHQPLVVRDKDGRAPRGPPRGALLLFM